MSRHRTVRGELGRDRRHLQQGGNPPGLVRPVRRVDQGKKGTAEVDNAFLGEIELGATRSPATSPCATPASPSASSTTPCRRPSTASSSCASARTAASRTTGGSRHCQRRRHLRRASASLSRGRPALQLGPLPLRARSGSRRAPDSLTLGLAIDDKALRTSSGVSTTPRVPTSFQRAAGRHSRRRSTSSSSAR